MKKLEGKVALVTGGTSGIGLAAARLFHDEGARVIVTGSNPKTLDVARTELDGVAEVIASDAGDGAAVRALFDQVARDHGGLDVLFLNAGIVRSAPITELDERVFDDIFRINVKGPWLALRAAIPLLRAGGSVVVNTSMTNKMGMVGGSVYGPSKAALRSLVRVAAAELAPKNVRVNAVSPGPTDTGIIAKGNTPEQVTAIEAHLASMIPMGRLGRPDEIARVALFLASSDSSFMTGEELVADGGLTSI